ncbi:MAG: hypothetical protein ACKO38_11145, partial [Planctomycetota bacterium]
MASPHRSEFADEPQGQPQSPNPYAAPTSVDAALLGGPSSSTDVVLDTFGPPTTIRYQVLAFAVTMSVLLYLHRFALSVAMPPIGSELG